MLIFKEYFFYCEVVREQDFMEKTANNHVLIIVMEEHATFGTEHAWVVKVDGVVNSATVV